MSPAIKISLILEFIGGGMARLFIAEILIPWSSFSSGMG
jgi:hypothetical protein